MRVQLRSIQLGISRLLTALLVLMRLLACPVLCCAVLWHAVVAIMLPTLLSSTAEAVKDFKAELALSRFESVLMLLCYGLFLIFQLVTHR